MLVAARSPLVKRKFQHVPLGNLRSWGLCELYLFSVRVAESCFRIRYVCHVYVSVLAWLLSPAVLFSES